MLKQGTKSENVRNYVSSQQQGGQNGAGKRLLSNYIRKVCEVDRLSHGSGCDFCLHRQRNFLENCRIARARSFKKKKK